MALLTVELVAGALRKRKLDAWKVHVHEEEKAMLSLGPGCVGETTIVSRRRQAEVTVYKRFGKKLIGDARFTIFAYDEVEFTALIKDALAICGTAKKQQYPLPKPQAYASVKTTDPVVMRAFKGGAAEEVNEKIRERFEKALTKEKGVSFSMGELVLSATNEWLANSEGLRATNTSTGLFAEAILAARQGRGAAKREEEFLTAMTVVKLADFNPEKFIGEAARYARDVVGAKQFSRTHTAGIVLSGAALQDFWHPLMDVTPAIIHATAQTTYRKLSRYKRGTRVTTNRQFTIASDPLVDWNPRSSPFDHDGVASKRVTVIKDGVFTEYLGSQRFSHYLGVKPTGAVGATRLSPGVESEKKLLSDGVLEIVAFSSFSPNSLSGDFSAEVRLAYRHAKGKRIPINHVMFTGNVFKMLDSMRASSETIEMNGYVGPRHVRFDDGASVNGF